jgi:hypothetical protein
MGGFVLSSALLQLSRVATDTMLGVMLVFTVQYLVSSRWWAKPIGWSIVIERVSFVALLALLLAQTYWPFSITSANDFLAAEAVLLFTASAGVGLGTFVLWRLRHRPPRARTAQELISGIMSLPPDERAKVAATLAQLYPHP